MKWIILTTVSTLVLSTLVVPSAKAIHPELLSTPVHPTISAETMIAAPLELQIESTQKPQKPVQKSNSAIEQFQLGEEPPFGYFEKIYREKYGS